MLFFSIALALLRTCIFHETNSALIFHDGKNETVEGIVSSVKIKDYYTAFTVRVGKEKVLVRVTGLSEDDRIKAYDFVGRKVRVTGFFSIPDGRRNPGCFDYRTYLKARGIYTICETNKYKIRGLEIKRPLLHLINMAKASYYEKIKPYLDGASFGMSNGILFGETSYIDEDIYDSFKQNGIAHILAVSGLHVSMTYELISRIFKRKSKLIDLFSISLVCIYAALANFSVSVLRASAMIILKIAAPNFDKRYDSLSAISFVASVMLFLRPYLLYDSSMQLSFAAAYTMALLMPYTIAKAARLSDKLKSNIPYALGNAALPGLSAWFGTMPLCAYHFMTISLAGIIINPFAIALAGMILPIGIIAFISSLILPSGLSSYAVYLASELLKILCKGLNILNSFGTILSSDNSVPSPPPGMLILFYALFLFMLSETRIILLRKKEYKKELLFAVSIVSLCCILPFSLKFTNSIFPWEYGVPKISFIDVGQGDCIHIHYGGKDILLDGGGNFFTNVGEKTLKPYLLKNGIRNIDLAIISHEDMDHCKGIYELNEIFEIKEILSNKDVYGETGLDENDSCIVAGMTIDTVSYLFMGDADYDREYHLLDSYKGLSCDVLKVGHHGSPYSTSPAFVKNVKPSFAVISAGKGNSYGHPASRVIELLESSGIMYSRTDESGAICFKKASEKEIIFINAAKDTEWHIPRQPHQNTHQEP